MKLVLALMLALSASVIGAGTAFASHPPTTVLDGLGSEANKATYWEAYFADRGFDYDCTKVDRSGEFTTTVAHDAIIIKNDSRNFIWQPAPADTYTTDKGVSHWFYCDGSPEQEVVNPAGSIGGPCADPAYYGVFDNTASNVTITFRFRWYTKSGLHTVVKDVPAGAIFRTWEHWSKPFTLVRVAYKDPETGLWVNLASELTVKGNYPACEYDRGFTYP